MSTTILFICQIILLLIVFGVLSSVDFGLNIAYQNLAISHKKKKQLRIYFFAGTILWLALLVFLAESGLFDKYDNFPPFVLLTSLPILLFSIYLASTKVFGIILKMIPIRWLFYIQAFRLLLEILLWIGYRMGFVPIQLTFEWLNFDIIVGITAPMAAYTFFSRKHYRKPEAVIWNVFGIILALNFLFIMSLTTIMPWKTLNFLQSPTFFSVFPFIWIPGFLIPVAISIHIFSLKQIVGDQLIRHFNRLKKSVLQFFKQSKK